MKALITGASSGIGRDMARVLARRGWDLIITARREERLYELKEQFKNVNVECICADVSKEEDCVALYEKTKDQNIDMLINNAGFGMCGKFTDSNIKRDIEMINTNIKAVHILTKLFLQDFVKRDSGYILNTASSAGFMAGPMMAEYYATKNYVVRLTQAIYEELRRDNINVKISVLCPGPVKTEFDSVADVRFSMKGLDSFAVAKYAVDKALSGKLIIIPGISMKFAKFGMRFLSDKAILKIAYKFQRRKKG